MAQQGLVTCWMAPGARCTSGKSKRAHKAWRQIRVNTKAQATKPISLTVCHRRLITRSIWHVFQLLQPACEELTERHEALRRVTADAGAVRGQVGQRCQRVRLQVHILQGRHATVSLAAVGDW